MTDEHKDHEHKHDAHATHHKTHEKHNKVKVKKTLIWQIVSAVLLIALIGLYFNPVGYSSNDSSTGSTISKEEAGEKMLSFINDNLVAPGTEAEIKSIVEENGLYKMELSLQGQDITSYSTKDGEIFFPQAMNIAEVEEQMQGQKDAEEKALEGIEKSDKPEVEVFVMSHCPYGTQIEKGMIPVMETLKGKADIKIKFVNYAMHGEKEVYEQRRQVCIQDEFSSKYLSYLKCFLKEGKSDECVAETDIDTSKLKECEDALDKEYLLTENLNDKSTWKGNFPPFLVHDKENTEYGVRGSPTLVINGATASSGRDASSLLKAICNAFNEAPEECDTDLSAEGSPSPGFGYTPSATGAATATAGCGS